MPAAFAMLIFFYLALSSLNMVIPKNDVASENTTFELVEHEAAYSCSGNPHDCDFYDLNQPDCLAAGCTYDNDLCSGIPSACAELDPVTCLIAGCEYSRGESTYINTTVTRISYACSYCTYKDQAQAWFNAGMAFLSLLTAFGLLMLKKGNDW
jgi:hypothetical protein